MRKLMTVLLAALLVASAASVALAQGIDGTLRGDVKDPKGLAIDGAKVTVKNEGTGAERRTTTSSGSFNAPNLLVGIYTVTVEIEGFKKYVRKGVVVSQNQVTEVAISLELGSVTTVVEVTASGELVQTTTSTLASTWDNRTVNELALPSIAINPDPQNLAILLPGTTTQSGGVAGYGGAIGGNRPRDNNFVLDGIDNNNIGVTGPNQVVIPDAVGDLTIITNQFSAEYGHSTAGQFIMNTKSGTNQLHGSAFWYNNNRAYNSLDNLDQGSPKPRLDLNRAGGTVGGPVIKDHWFIFGAYQYTTLGAASVPSSAIDVPTAAGFATLQTLASTPGTGVSAIMVKALTDTLPAAPAGGGPDQAVKNNATGATVIIPTGAIAPAAPNFQAEHDFAISSDVDTGKHRFSARFLYDRFRAPLIGGTPLPIFTGANAFDNRSVTFSDVYAVTPRVVNEFRTGYRRTVGPNLTVPSVTTPGKLDVYPNFDLPALGLVLGPNGCSPQTTVIDTYQWTDTLSISKGAHNFKLGADVRLWISPVNFLPRARAEYRYIKGAAPDGSVTWLSNLDNFVHDGIPIGLDLRGIGNGNFAGNQKGFYWFFQDDWKVSSKLTLNLGIRYEYVNNPRALELQLQNSIADLANPTNLGLPGVVPLIFSKLPGTDTNNWGPRVGFAYDVFGDHKTSIRGGFAVAYDFIFNNFYTANALSPNLQVEEDELIACARTPAPAYCVAGKPNYLGPFVANGGLPPAAGSATLTLAQARSGASSLIFDIVDPKVFTWSLGVQHEFAKNYALEVRYVGTHGISLPVQIRLNPRQVAPTSAFLPTFVKSSDVPATLPATPNLANFLTFGGAGKVYGPDGFNGNLTTFVPRGQSIYHGGSVDLTRRLTGLGRWGHGAFLKANYTFSKEIDNSTNEFFTSIVNPRRAQDFNDLANERGRGAIDHTHKFALAAIYELPWYNGSSGFLKGFTNGWQISAVYLAETGQPVTLQSGVDANNNGDGAGDRAVFNPGFTVVNSTSDVNRVCRNSTTGATSIATSCASNAATVGYVAACAPGEVGCTKNPNAEFITAQKGAIANLGRDTAGSAGINNWDISIIKKTHLWSEARYVEFRATFINAFNHAQPILGGASIEQTTNNATSGGQLVAVGDPPNNQFLTPANVFSSGGANAPYQRVITFGLRLIF